jgi:CRISPR-associated Csx2 family protein
MQAKSRNVFISFLGANAYQECQYQYGTQQSQPVFYVQQAIAQTIAKNWGGQDAFYVFTTSKAIQDNWSQRLVKAAHAPSETEAQYAPDGLQAHLLADFKGGLVQSKPIPDGNTEEEIWAIFDAVLGVLQVNDAVYLDITNSFRSLPTFATTLLNYAKQLKNIQVGGIFYGNYEGRALNDGVAQILNLSNIELLQRWTSASESFLRAGSATLLADLVERTNTALAKDLLEFTAAISNVRGFQLCYEMNIDKLKTDVQKLSNGNIELQLKLILKKITAKLSPFQTGKALNALRAVDWCVLHNMPQAGYTFLEEGLKTLVLDHAGVIPFIQDHDVRKVAGNALFGNTKAEIEQIIATEQAQKQKKFENQAKNKGKTYYPQSIPTSVRNQIQIMVDFVGAHQLTATYKKLIGAHGLRNDINHGGFGFEPATTAALTKDLGELIAAVKLGLKIT